MFDKLHQLFQMNRKIYTLLSSTNVAMSQLGILYNYMHYYEDYHLRNLSNLKKRKILL